MFKSIIIHRAIFAFLLLLSAGVTAFGQGTAFTYQGRLTDSGNPADGLFDMQFKLFDSTDFVTGVQVGSTITIPAVQVTNGVFTVQLEFGACPTCFNGAARFLEIAIRPAGSPDPYTLLSPRQAITSAPYAVRSATAATADTATNATQLGGLTSGGFIQNSGTQQAGTNFNIGGSGTVAGTLTGGVVNATTQYNINGSRVLSASGLQNLFVGIGAGVGNTSGVNNSYFGFNAGAATTDGVNNSFFGRDSGFSDNTGLGNTIIGAFADVGANNLLNATAIGYRAMVGQSNSLVLGSISGVNSCTAGVGCASVNVGIGTTAPTERLHVVGNGLFTGTLTGGVVNATTQYNIAGLRMLVANGPFNDGSTILATSNTFLGESAGLNTMPFATLNSIVGKFNSFFGANAGKANTSGSRNSFLGADAGKANTTGFQNSFFGRDAGAVNTTGSENSFFGSLAGDSNTTGFQNSFFGSGAGGGNTTGAGNSFFGLVAGIRNAAGINNTLIGTDADFSGENTTGNRNTLLGSNTRVLSGISNATAIGARAQVDQSNSLVLGSISGVNNCTAANGCDSVNVGIGTTSPSATLHVVRDTSDVATPLAIIESAGNQAPLAFRVDGPEVARIRADNLGNLVFVTLSGLSKNIIFRAGEDLGTDMIIQSTGNVGIGDSTPDDKLDVEGDIRVGTGTTGCVKDADGTVLTGSCSSDARLKREITSFPMLLDKVVMLRPVHFYWRQDEYKDKAFGAGQSFGLIAQEVEEVLPELVTQDEQGLKAVRYNKLPLLMLQAIKELKAENDSLKQRLDEMSREREQIKKQQTRIESLTKIICLTHPDADICK